MRALTWAAASMAACLACDGTVDVPNPLPGSGDTVPVVPAGATAEPFSEVEEATTATSAITQRERLVITNGADWEAYWLRFTGAVTPTPPTPSVDFTEFRIAAAAMGSRPTGGYAVDVTEVRGDDDRFYVVVLETEPGPGCVVTQATTAPAAAVRVPADERPVLFVEERVVNSCG
jgi:hypothetical protein